MRLKSIQISNYKCIRKPCEFDISDITCLVGKNESGKTAILEAIYRLNPVIAEHGFFNMDDDYPRMDVEDYRLEVEQGKREPAIVTRAVFALDDSDIKELERELPGILAQRELVLTKGYLNELNAELTINEEAAVEALLSKAKLPPQKLKDLAKCTSMAELAESLSGAGSGSESSTLLTKIKQIQDKGLLNYLYDKYFEAKVPKFLYFDEFYQMQGHVNIQGLIQRQQTSSLLESDYPFLGLIDLARLDLKDISNPARALERDNRLEGASNHLTKSIMKYWSQNKFLEIRFDIRPGLPNDPEGMQSGLNLWGHVYNSRQKVGTLLGRRSRGFVWFFSFLAWFTQQKRKNIPLILLLDEPSQFLHGAAQSDLLRFLEDETRSGFQVVYTTQSPHMVEPSRFDRVRIVEDGSMDNELPYTTQDGTHVYTDVLEPSADSILALESSLGYQMCDSLFTEENILIVDRASDLIYLQVMSSLLEREGREGLDPRWTITPIGGSSKLPAFFSLMGHRKNGIIASLIGIPAGMKDRIAGSTHATLFRKIQVYPFTDFTDTAAADIEDLFEIDFYLNLVNSEYGKGLGRPISKGHLRGTSSRIIELISMHLESNPPPDNAQFCRERPALFFAANTEALKKNLSKDTFRRFESINRTLNALL